MVQETRESAGYWLRSARLSCPPEPNLPTTLSTNFAACADASAPQAPPLRELPNPPRCPAHAGTSAAATRGILSAPMSSRCGGAETATRLVPGTSRAPARLRDASVALRQGVPSRAAPQSTPSTSDGQTRVAPLRRRHYPVEPVLGKFQIFWSLGEQLGFVQRHLMSCQIFLVVAQATMPRLQ